jgi:NAD-dependent dihydropyrimidine dehydrogenase PreA subunit
MVDAKQSRTQSLSWFRPRGRTSSSGVLEALYCSAPGVPVVGLLQAMRERKRGSQVPGGVAEDVVGELESECVMYCASCLVSCPVFSLLPLSCGGGVRLPFIGQG